LRQENATENATGECQRHDTSQGDIPPDLADVVAAWPDLPDPIKAAVLALVKAARWGA
jgi:hypothetical protein